MDIVNYEVDKMMKEEVNPHPHDFVSVFNGIQFPEINHEVLEIPGKFKKREPMCGFTSEGKIIYMDQVASVYPDNDKIKRELATNYEYLMGGLDQEKKERLLDYDVSIQVILKKPAFEVVITDKKYDVDEECMMVDGSAIRILYRTFDKEVLYKTLNRLSNIDYFKQEMSGYDYMKWAQCIAFATKPYARDFLEKSVDLFTRVEKINFSYQKNLHMSLKVMIKSQFDDEKTIRRLLTMITKAIPHSNIPEVCKQESLPLPFQEAKRVLEEKINEINAELAERNAELAESNQEILKLKQKIEKLEK